ncbi:MAG TPA: FkbM family methyltransferase [Pedobacter sp.]|jgi:hypothetical protein
MIAKIKEVCLNKGISIGMATVDAQLKEFFQKVRPCTTDHKLIRVGGEKDAGYLIPDDLEGIKTCFSPGVSLEAYFENDLSKRGIKSFLADYSVEFPPIHNPLFSFEKKYLGMENDSMFMTLESWVNESLDVGNESDMILQMDIEGGEYNVLIDTSNDLFKKFRIIIIEFHNLNFLFHQFGFQMISACFYKLLKNFQIVHIHPNNVSNPIHYKNYMTFPEMEFTFLRKDRITTYEPNLSFPHELDRKNSENKKDIVLPDCWYK